MVPTFLLVGLAAGLLVPRRPVLVLGVFAAIAVVFEAGVALFDELTWAEAASGGLLVMINLVAGGILGTGVRALLRRRRSQSNHSLTHNP